MYMVCLQICVNMHSVEVRSLKANTVGVCLFTLSTITSIVLVLVISCLCCFWASNGCLQPTAKLLYPARWSLEPSILPSRGLDPSSSTKYSATYQYEVHTQTKFNSGNTQHPFQMDHLNLEKWPVLRRRTKLRHSTFRSKALRPLVSQSWYRKCWYTLPSLCQITGGNRSVTNKDWAYNIG